MAAALSRSDTPRKLLLATDLSARCDRALERAVLLAATWGAQLTLVHVFEDAGDPIAAPSTAPVPSWRRPSDAIAVAKRRIRDALRADLGDAVERAVVRIEEGEPADIIERVASSESSDLIITGIASERPFARQPVTPGKTVEQLMRRSPTPVLIVHNRARAHYRHILVATDFSDISARALRTALMFFPQAPLRLLHAFDLPYVSMVPDAASLNKSWSAGLSNDLEDFLASMDLSSEDRRRLDPLIERGRPDNLIRAYVNDHDADLVVLGTQSRSTLVEALVGSTAKSILAALACDALVVNAVRR